jgi:hypothetical protein
MGRLQAAVQVALVDPPAGRAGRRRRAFTLAQPAAIIEAAQTRCDVMAVAVALQVLEQNVPIGGKPNHEG